MATTAGRMGNLSRPMIGLPLLSLSLLGNFTNEQTGPFSNDKGMTIFYHQHSGRDHYGCWSQGLRRGKSSFLIFKITEEMSDDQTK